MLYFLYIINCLLILYILFKRYGAMLYILQLEKYKLKRFINWFFINIKTKNVYVPLGLSLFQLVYIIWINNSYLFASLSLVFSLLYLPFLRAKKQKVKFVVTYRIKRLIASSVVISLIFCFFTWLLSNSYLNVVELIFVSLIVLNFLLYDILVIAFYGVIPVEKWIQNKFITKARQKLIDQHLDVVGITGSYGKTSTKMIVSDLLTNELFVCRTPKSFNTPMGVAITINNHLKRIDEVLVCEMGATQIGDIKELCDIVHPKIGILTEIGPQHLDTFLNMTNIIQTKFELIESLPQNGLAILNYDNRFIRGYQIKNHVPVITYGIQSEDVNYRAINIKYGTFGSTFEVVFPNQEHHLFKTKLLGKHNIYNILAAIVVADYYKVDINRLKTYVSQVNAIDNRLQLKHFDQFTIIDDAFNSNLTGFKNAIDILNHFDNKKIIITPGIVDLGKEQYQINYEIGEELANVCDYVVLVGKKQTQSIYDGLTAKGYSNDQIFVTNDFQIGYNHVMKEFNSNFTLLIENDLPDNYSEE
jgi:UDP-N-acetylmuramoyl-tripeptide--D-alanyl-D-alanine ligase